MAKNLKLTIKNAQIAEAVNLGGLKSKLAGKKAANEEEQAKVDSQKSAPSPSSKEAETEKESKEEAPRIRARSKSAFAEPASGDQKTKGSNEDASYEQNLETKEVEENDLGSPLSLPKRKTSEELRKEIFGEELEAKEKEYLGPIKHNLLSPVEGDAQEIPHPKKEGAPQTSEISPSENSKVERIKAEKPAEEKVREERSREERPRREFRDEKYSEPRQRTRNFPPASASPFPKQSFSSPNPSRERPFKERHPERTSDRPREGGHSREGGNYSREGGYSREGNSSREGNYSRSYPREKLSLPTPSSSAYIPSPSTEARVKLGPTGRHINDLLPQKHARSKHENEGIQPTMAQRGEMKSQEEDARDKNKTSRPKIKGREREGDELTTVADDKKGGKPAKFKEFRDIKPVKRQEQLKFDGRDRQGLRDTEEGEHWRKRKAAKVRYQQEDTTIRPSSLKIRSPISIKDLAGEMKLKASQLISKLFLQGIVVTLNDLLEDETTIQLLGQEFGCEITIDTSEEERIRITGKSIKEEIENSDQSKLTIRPSVVAFMGHVDHGKTSLIDAIRKSNRASGETGAITQHIGAFRCSTPVGDIAILDTPGHEAFSSMRARGADVTDIVVLVVAGDEGIRQQTVEAIQHAKAANVTIVVAINKSDKPNFNPENVYRQLADQDLLPEPWGGQTITVNCSAVTGEGIEQLLEMLALQAEVLELKADPSYRARGTVLESEMHKGMGAIATVLVQNGTLRCGDALVFDQLWGRVKTMHDEFHHELQEAGPSTPVEITGLSGLPEAGQEFIVVKSEKEAREIAEARMQGMRQFNLLQTKKFSMENLLQASEVSKKILNVVLRADVQGSLEALKAALMKIESEKAQLNIIFSGVGEVSESDVQLAAVSKAVIIGFHTQIESHADILLKQLGVQVRLHNIIYHAIDDVKLLLSGLLDKIAQETDKGKAEVKATFKSSHYGVIAGCIVTEGTIHRNHSVRLRRGKEIAWKGSISSLKRVKEDVREVSKGLECGIVLANFQDVREGDILEAYEVTYITQEL